MANPTVHKNGQIPDLKGAEKDHKENENEVKMRPIVNAMDGPKKNISKIFSDVATPVIESMGNDIVCYSTEELLESFENYNNKVDNNNVETSSEFIIGSMDATALYPSLKAEKSASIVVEEVVKSDIIFKNIDTQELGVYLRKNLSQEYIKEKGIEKLLPIKISGRRKFITEKDENCIDVEIDDDEEYLYIESIANLFDETNVVEDIVEVDDKNIVEVDDENESFDDNHGKLAEKQKFTVLNMKTKP